MSPIKEAVDEFLAQDRLAVAGVSRSGNEAANAIYKKLKGAGYSVFPTNPSADEVEGDPCYPDLKSIPDGVSGVVIATHPKVALTIVEECSELGINHVWFHRSFGQGSVAQEAISFCRDNNIKVIPGGCPMMFVEKVDIGHKCMRWFLGMTGGLPKEV
ncbi:MAG: CoA-binding protein [Candidatus Promineifilaceae bacterium]